MQDIRNSQNSYFSYPESNGVIEQWHRNIHSSPSHYINATNTNWNTSVPFYFMSYRATPLTTTGFSPFYLLHGREMTLPSSDSLKVHFPQDNPSHEQRIENLKSNLKLTYRLVAKANRKSHQRNKRYYESKAKPRKFTVNGLVDLYNPAIKPELTRKFSKLWQGPYKVTKKLSELNYEIIGQYSKKRVVHVNRLNRAYSSEQRMPKSERKPTRKLQRKTTQNYSESEDSEYQVR